MVLPADCHILVLEDEPAVLRLVTAALHTSGFTSVSATATVSAAREAWKEHEGSFHMLVTDFSLPDGSAPDVIREFLTEKPELRVVLMTGFSGDVLDTSDHALRRVGLIQKPFRPAELRQVVTAEMSEIS